MGKTLTKCLCCEEFKEVFHQHHISYKPEIKIRLCDGCHAIINTNRKKPRLYTKTEKFVLRGLYQSLSFTPKKEHDIIRENIQIIMSAANERGMEKRGKVVQFIKNRFPQLGINDYGRIDG